MEKNKKIIINICLSSFLFIVLSSVNILNAQDKDLIHCILHKSDSLLSAKDYNRTIDVSQEGIELYASFEKDSLYTELLRNQYVAYSWINNWHQAYDICREAVIAYESFGKIDQTLASHYRSLANFTNNSEERHICIKKIFKTGFFRYSDYFKYKDSFWAGSVLFEEDYPKILKKVCEEEDFIKGLNFKYLNPFFMYIKASFSPFAEAVPLVKEAISLTLEYSKEEPRDRFLYEYYELLYSLYIDNGMSSSAALQYKNMLALISEYWEMWGLSSPWSCVGSYINKHAMQGFEFYIEALKVSKQYNDIVYCCNDVLADERLDALDSSYRRYVLNELKQAYIYCGNDDALKSIDIQLLSLEEANRETKSNDDYCVKAISFYQNGDLAQASKYAILALENGWEYSDSDRCNYEFNNPIYDILIQTNNYDIVSKHAREQINKYTAYVVDEGENETWYPISDDSILEQMKPEDFRLGSLREYFHHANECSVVWLSYYYLSRISALSGNLSQAIEYQKMCVDLVRTNWWADPHEREDILKDRKYRAIELNIDTESRMIFELGSYYAESGQYQKAYSLFEEAIKLNIDAILAKVSYGSLESKESNWLSRETLLVSIEIQLIALSDRYPQFADLLFMIANIRNGFILNEYNYSNGRISNYKSADLIKLQNEIKELSTRLERSYYNNQDSKSILIDLEYKQGVLYESLAIRNHKDVLISPKDIILPDNSVLAFYISVPEKGDCSFIGCAAPSINGGVKKRAFNMNEIYALVYRSSWDHPKVVRINSVRDLLMNEDVDFYSYFVTHEQFGINSVYSSNKTFDCLVAPIIESANLMDSESILYVPTDLINEIAIENVRFPNSNHFLFEKYNIRRLSNVSSIRSLNHGLTSDGSIIAFDGSNSLVGTVSELQYIQDNHPLGTTIISSTNGTESRFYSLDGKAPHLLHIGTHGYNYITSSSMEPVSDGTDDVINYLKGGRDYIEDESVSAMYLTGLRTFVNKPNPITPTDGYLSAKEISLMDLTGCDLVVLSACSTGLGAVSSEGVYGLQRGFKMAGVKGILVSLWDVDDTATALLMKTFYKYLFDGYDASNALVQAKMFLRNYEDDGVDEYGNVHISSNVHRYEDPYYWGGFVLID